MAHDLTESAEIAADVIAERRLEQEQEKESEKKFVGIVAMSTMVMALFSAIGALFAGISANDAMLVRTAEILTETRLETDRLEIDILAGNALMLEALGLEVEEEMLARIAEDREEMEEFAAEVEFAEDEVELVMVAHERLAVGVTLLSIAITLGGMALVTRRRPIWYLGLGLSVVGAAYVVVGLQTHLGLPAA